LIERELDQHDKTLAAACIAANQDESRQKEIDEWQSLIRYGLSPGIA